MKRELRLLDEVDRFAAGQELTHALALTFGYDGDVAYERLWKPLVEQYGLRMPLVFADGAVDAGAALEVRVVRVRRRGGVFHPKLFVAVRDDAVLVVIGSANLTKGGLGENLELGTALCFEVGNKTSAPRDVLASVLDFLEGALVQRLEGRADRRSLDAVTDLVRHARLVETSLPARATGPEIRFIHDDRRAIWKTVREVHGDDPVDELVVVSPFYERDDPEDVDASLLHHVLDGGGVPWRDRSRARRCLLCVASLDEGARLPVESIRSHGRAIELRARDVAAEPRNLHAKLVALVGRRKATLLWGSPNFTPSALTRSAEEGGNLECGLVVRVPVEDWAKLREGLEIDRIFVRGGRLPATSPAPGARPSPTVVASEVTYDPTTKTLTVHGEVWSSDVRRVRIEADVNGETVVLLDAKVEAGPFACSVTRDDLEVEEVKDLSRLRFDEVRILAATTRGRIVVEDACRVNVQHEDALAVRGGYLHARAVDPSALSSPAAFLVPSNAPPEQRVAAVDAHIARLKAQATASRPEGVRHQASLDVFFRQVRHGLDGHMAILRAKRSKYAFLRWSTQMRRAMEAPPALWDDPARHLYAMTRVAEHVRRVLDEAPQWGQGTDAALRAVVPAELAAPLDAVDVAAHVDANAASAFRKLRRGVVRDLRRIR